MTDSAALLELLKRTLDATGVGWLLRSGQLRREGSATVETKALEMITLAEAERLATEIRLGKSKLALGSPASDIILRVAGSTGRAAQFPPQALAVALEDRMVGEELRKEVNVSKSIVHAQSRLEADTSVPPSSPVDLDWMLRWRDGAATVSTDQLQRLWGNALAGELKSPGRYSLRTLEFLKSLSTSEAHQISAVAPFFVEKSIIRTQQPYLDRKGLTFSKLLEMQDLGILSGVESVSLSLTIRSTNTASFLNCLRSHGKGLVIRHEDAARRVSLDNYKVTVLGTQITSLGSFEPDIGYLRGVGEDIVKQGFAVSLADITQISDDSGACSNEQQILLKS